MIDIRIYTKWSGEESFWIDPPFELTEPGEFIASAIGEETQDMKPILTMADLRLTDEHYTQFLNDPNWGEGAIVKATRVEEQNV